MGDADGHGDFRHGGTAVTAEKGVGGAGGEAEIPGNQIPRNGSEEAGEDDIGRDDFEVDHALSDGGGDARFEREGGDEVPEGGPGDGLEGREDAGRNDGGNGVGCVMKAVDVIEGQGDRDDQGYQDEGGIHGERLAIFNHDVLEGVGDILAGVDGAFQIVINLFELDDLDGVGFVVEEVNDRLTDDHVHFAFDAIDFDAMLHDPRHVIERGDGLREFARAIVDQVADLHDRTGDGIDPIGEQAMGDVFNAIEHIVEAGAEGMDVLRVERSDEGLIEPGEEFVDNFVPFVFKLFDAGSHQFEMGVPFGDPICQSLSGLGNNAGLVVKLFEEFLFLGKKSHSASVNATWQSFKRVVRPRSVNL